MAAAKELAPAKTAGEERLSWLPPVLDFPPRFSSDEKPEFFIPIPRMTTPIQVIT